MGDTINIGGSVIVNPGTIDPDTGMDIAGWQGRVVAARTAEGKPMVTIHWDSLTLKNMPLTVIEQCEESGMDWAEITLRAADVQPADARDTERQAMEAEEQLRAQSFWLSSGPEGKRIHKVLKSIDPDDSWAAFRVWYGHLSATLKLPFEAAVDEWPEGEPLRPGEHVTVLDFNKRIEDRYGVLVDVKSERGLLTFPLCALSPLDEHSDNYDVLQEYHAWFAAR